MAQTTSRNKIKSRQTNDIPASTDIGVANSSLVKTALNASGVAPIYACRAWVNFNGTEGVVAIRASGNVSSITDGGAGTYTINFTHAMEDINYSVCAMGYYSDATPTAYIVYEDARISTRDVSSIGIRTSSYTTAGDSLYVQLAIFR